jgi:hypothetical protein
MRGLVFGSSRPDVVIPCDRANFAVSYKAGDLLDRVDSFNSPEFKKAADSHSI